MSEGGIGGNYDLLPVSAKVPPRPIIMTPPAALRVETRFGDRANHCRAVPAARAQMLSETSAITRNTAPNVASCSGMLPAW